MKYRPTPLDKLPQAQTIKDKHVLKAYLLGSRYHQRRIEAYARMDQEALEELIVREPPRI